MTTSRLTAQVIKDLGKRHVTYGVASHHVPVMKQVFYCLLLMPRLVPTHASLSAYRRSPTMLGVLTPCKM
jgi:hypothetical protein